MARNGDIRPDIAIIGTDPAGMEIAMSTAALGVPVTLVSGAVDAASLSALHARFDGGCFALPAGPATLDACVRDASALLSARVEAIARLFVASRKASG